MERTVLHIIGGGSRSRAEQARIVFALGHHAEIYADLSELLERPPRAGIVLATDDGIPGSVDSMIRAFAVKGVCLPVVMAGAAPPIDRVVAAIKAGALDYLVLPLEMNAFASRLDMISAEAELYCERFTRESDARRAVERLSPRERDVLGLLSAGCSNKEIARTLAISPRTVEIHRGNMMMKLGAGHAAHAIRLWIDAVEGPPQAAVPGRAAAQRPPVVAGTIGERPTGWISPSRRYGQRQ